LCKLRPLLTTTKTRSLHLSKPLFKEAEVIQIREAITRALDEELARDPKVFILGEEVGAFNGAYKVTKGLMEKHGAHRVIDAPITESGFAGLGIGAAMGGTIPVIEFMTWNFALQAIDHIVNTAAKSRYMSGGAIKIPITFRGPNGPPGAVGAQHSQDFGAWYASIPGLKVATAYSCDDAKGITKAAIRDPNPVILLESEVHYNAKFPLSDEAQDPNYLIPFGKAKIERVGKHVTLISYARLVGQCLIAAEELEKEGISAEVINLRSLRPLDLDTIINSIKKTGRVVTAEEGFPACGIGAELISIANEYCFDYLDAPPERITSADVPMPYAKPIEDLAIPQAINIINAAKRVCYRKK